MDPPKIKPDPFPKPEPTPTPAQTRTPASNGNGKSKQASSGLKTSVDITDDATRPDWLPPGWKYKEYVRTSGASAGTKDKYFIDPITSRRFRSKKEVFRYIETGTTPKQKRKTDAEALNAAPPNTEITKRTKAEAKPKVSAKNFKYDDVPEKVKWCLTNVYDGTFGAKINDGDKVPESSKQEWHAAFTYLTLQNGGDKFVLHHLIRAGYDQKAALLM